MHAEVEVHVDVVGGFVHLSRHSAAQTPQINSDGHLCPFQTFTIFPTVRLSIVVLVEHYRKFMAVQRNPPNLAPLDLRP